MRIAIINSSIDVSREQAAAMTAACALQLERDVKPAWAGASCEVRLYRRGAQLPRGSLAIVIMSEYDDEEDRREGYLGYHTEDDNGVRYGRVYTKPILDDHGSVLGLGNSISVTLSHEVIEAYVDPDMNLWAEGGRGTFWSYEACDPVESSSYDVRAGGRSVGVSNFVVPAWFDLEHQRGERYDFLGKLRAPFDVHDDGYAIYRQGRRTLTRWGRRYDLERKRRKLRAKSVPLARSARRYRQRAQ
jgi:hypothetical protein